MSKNNPATAPTAALKTQIIIVGGGAGGLELAAKLGAKYGRKRHDIILVERNRTHIWKPLLHEVATGSLDANLDEVGYRSHCHRWGYRFFHGALESIDRKSRQITVAPLLDEDGSELIGRHSIRFDYLLAVGSVTNDFSIHGVRENCLFLDDRAGLTDSALFARVARTDGRSRKRCARPRRDYWRRRYGCRTCCRTLQRGWSPALLRTRSIR
jgi:NADH dehydrogenase FAD-containing subunit